VRSAALYLRWLRSILRN